MFEGTAKLRRARPRLPLVMGAVSSAVVLVLLSMFLFPSVGVFVVVLFLVAGGVAPKVTAFALKPIETEVSLSVDARGIVVDGVLLAPNEDIVEAYLRPGSDPVRSRFFAFAAQPMTVEIVLPSGYFNLEGDDPARTPAILAALGRPLVFAPAGYVPDTPAVRRSQRTVWLASVGPLFLLVLVMVLSLGGFLGYMYLLRVTGR